MNTKYYLSECLIIKNENQYLYEHITSDIEAGIDHFYIYDDKSDTPVEEYLKNNYPELLEFCTITVVREDELGQEVQVLLAEEGRQVAVYNNFLNTYGNETMWVSMTDTDEIWEGDMKAFLKRNEDKMAVFVPWIIHGANGHLRIDYTSLKDAFSESIVPFKVFDEGDPYISQNCPFYRGKSIYQCKLVKNHVDYFIDIHCLSRKVKNSDGSHVYSHPDYWSDIVKSYYEGDYKHELTLHHYFYRSLEDYIQKRIRSYSHVSTKNNSINDNKSSLSKWTESWVGLGKFFDSNNINPHDSDVKELLKEYNIKYISKYRDPEDCKISATELIGNPDSPKAVQFNRILKTIKKGNVRKLPKILITGVSGFIGRSLVKAIVDLKYSFDLYGVDINPIEMDECYVNKINFTQLDLRDKNKVENYFKENQFDGVIHLAAVSRVAVAENDSDNCIQTNFLATKNIVDQLPQNTWIIFSSSREVYGEPDNLPVKETDPKNPINIYGKCKLQSEEYVQNNMNKYLIFRFSNVYGNEFDLDNRVLPLFVNKSIKNEVITIEGGEQVIDFTYIDDVVTSIITSIKLLNSGLMTKDIIHLCPGEGNSLQSVVRFLGEYLEKGIKVEVTDKRDYDVVKFIGNPEHRIKILGDREFKSLKEGLIIYINRMIRKNKNEEA